MAYRWLAAFAFSAVLVLGCENGGTGGDRCLQGACGGEGGAGWVPACMTGPLCPACPDEMLCESNGDCSAGHVCVESGCRTNDGVPMKQCKLAPAGFCVDNSDCGEGRECMDLGIEGMRCVKTTPGCDTDFDCLLGFSCEEAQCVDRRVPCILDEDCPMSHVCEAVGESKFCQRVHIDCSGELDCAGLAPWCEDIDNDGRTECAGSTNPNVSAPACVNATCTDAAAPVCEVSGVLSVTACGQYGLCRDDNDCADGFQCVGLWLDGRKECVPTGGSCSHITDCPPRQVCASPRTGGSVSCQAGLPSP